MGMLDFFFFPRDKNRSGERTNPETGDVNGDGFCLCSMRLCLR